VRFETPGRSARAARNPDFLDPTTQARCKTVAAVDDEDSKAYLNSRARLRATACASASRGRAPPAPPCSLPRRGRGEETRRSGPPPPLRDDAFRKKLPGAARPLYDQALAHLGRESDEVMWHYRLGRRLLRLKEALPRRSPPGGPRRVTFTRLAEELGMSLSKFDKHCLFPEVYTTEAEVKKLLRRPKLSWGHVISLLYVTGAEERSRLAARAKDEKWTVDRLKDEAQKVAGGARRRGGRGRSAPFSAGPAVDLARLAQSTRAWVHVNRLWGEGGEPLRSVRERRLTKAMKKRLRKAVDELADLVEKARALLEVLQGVMEGKA
jgi:hypothetical protein